MAMPSCRRLPTLDEIRPKDPFKFSELQAQKLAEIAGMPEEDCRQLLLGVERLLADYWFEEYGLDRRKPVHVRDALSPPSGCGLLDRAHALLDGLDTQTDPFLFWDLEAAGAENIRIFRSRLQGFIEAGTRLLEKNKGLSSARTSRAARDWLIRDIADRFDRCVRVEADIPHEHRDRKCKYVKFALAAAGIPCPSAGDTRSRGEEHQGRLRQMLKQFEKPRRRTNHPPLPNTR